MWPATAISITVVHRKRANQWVIAAIQSAFLAFNELPFDWALNGIGINAAPWKTPPASGSPFAGGRKARSKAECDSIQFVLSGSENKIVIAVKSFLI